MKKKPKKKTAVKRGARTSPLDEAQSVRNALAATEQQLAALTLANANNATHLLKAHSNVEALSASNLRLLLAVEEVSPQASMDFRGAAVRLIVGSQFSAEPIAELKAAIVKLEEEIERRVKPSEMRGTNVQGGSQMAELQGTVPAGPVAGPANGSAEAPVQLRSV